MSDELKPCPFCGEAPFASLTDHSGTIACQTTDCAFVEADRGQSAEAVRVWNRRASDAELAALRARVARMSRDYDERQELAEVIDPGGSMCNETTGQSLSDVVRDLRARAVEEARAEEREACMKDVCPSCRAEMPLEGGSQFQHVRKDWYEVNYCKAERIRARGVAKEAKEEKRG